ncbi:hypothetical protein RB614_32690 [Phytohabitans sp. ZYX-F-186]|uniref:Uncharacterized protein n=1 Tax=Phytohabitans maris TaxID=3071409 RepID=A0ABU0ZQH3_9ACTN|nr:hypothetical protein [Phytohabitans sp. ZYX-F-186]MDQ7909289.1 hypothetical protein [Phytohabitans sp. ZYX-F-186]
MTDFHDRDLDVRPGWEGLIDLVRGDRNRDTQVDRLSYDLDGAGHFDLVKQDDDVPGDNGNAFRR